MGGSERKGTGTMGTMFIDGIHQLGTLEFWKTLLDSFEGLGPVAPILLAMVESIFPPLPLIAIVALNVAAHGGLLGFDYSWVGVAAGGTVVFLFWRRVVKRFFWKLASRSEKLKKAQEEYHQLQAEVSKNEAALLGAQGAVSYTHLTLPTT